MSEEQAEALRGFDLLLLGQNRYRLTCQECGWSEVVGSWEGDETAEMLAEHRKECRE
jgi:hypothetical protein